MGPRLLVIHGGPDWDHSYLRAFMAPLARRAELIFFDLRGCGRSQRLQDPSALHVAHVVEDVRQLIARLGAAPCAVLGFSFGGRIGLELIARHPHLVERFVLASSSAYPATAGSSRAPAGKIDPQEWALSRLDLDVWRPAARPAARDVIGRVRFSTQWWDALQAGHAISYPDRDYSSMLRDADLPVLALHGEFDRQFGPAQARRLAAEAPNVRLTVLPEAGHFAHMDAPDEWNHAIANFLMEAG